MSQKVIKIKENIHKINDEAAAIINKMLVEKKIFSINIMASPGAGKTSLIENTVKYFHDRYSIFVIDGDIASSLDADRAKMAGARAIQINTDGGCHLDANMILEQFPNIDLNSIDFLIIENVGNLVCPSSFKLGTHLNVLIASIPEGDDKPYKYPGMYRGVDVLIINKMDLLPYVPFRMNFFQEGVNILNPNVIIFELSCHTGIGLDGWYNWLENQLSLIRKNHE
jgi:hydrogenase nickel incorporation protein HypB